MKWLGSILAGLLVGFGLIQLIPYGRDHRIPPVNDEPQWPDPQTHDLARRACFDCHSNQTRWPWYSNIAPVSWLIYHDVSEGRQHINFSDWDRAVPQHVDEFRKVFEKNSMPPASYLLLHPEARLSGPEKQQLEEGLLRLAERYQH
ncbi:MAG: heme-binding domain-containing protein [Bacteroidota bacterium]